MGSAWGGRKEGKWDGEGNEGEQQREEGRVWYGVKDKGERAVWGKRERDEASKNDYKKKVEDQRKAGGEQGQGGGGR